MQLVRVGDRLRGLVALIVAGETERADERDKTHSERGGKHDRGDWLTHGPVAQHARVRSPRETSATFRLFRVEGHVTLQRACKPERLLRRRSVAEPYAVCHVNPPQPWDEGRSEVQREPHVVVAGFQRLEPCGASGAALGMPAGISLLVYASTAWPLNVGNMSTAATFVFTAGLGRRRPPLYDPAVSDGSILVGVESPRADKLEDIEAALAGIQGVSAATNP